MKFFSPLAIFLLLLGCNGGDRSDKYVAYINYDQLSINPKLRNPSLLEAEYKERNHDAVHQVISIDSVDYYVVEGDHLMNEFEYMQYQLSKLIDPKDLKMEAITMMVVDSVIVRWPENKAIKYCVTRNSFPTPDQYNMVRENLRQATREWEEACNVKFEYDESKDGQNLITASGGLDFVVLGFNSKNRFIASAFFPNDSVNRRRLLVDPSYFSTNFNKVGVFRHELGHVLGLRHENIRPEAPQACQGEDVTNVLRITPYDPKSVMHYFCGGMGTIELNITDIDRQGMQSIYGAPKN